MVDQGEGEQTIKLAKTSDSDDWKTFKKQSGVSRREMKKAFGKNYKEVLGSSNEIDAAQIKGDLGELLLEMEYSLNTLNNGDLTGNNCYGTALQLSSDGKIDPNGMIDNSGLFVNNELLPNYSSHSKGKTGDVIPYGTTEGILTYVEHAAVFLLDNTRKDENGNTIGGTQVFTKNGFSKNSNYQIQYENQMPKEYGSKVRIPVLEGKYNVQGIKVGPFFRKK